MRKRYKQLPISDFYCTECGEKGIPLPRREQKEAGHLKKIWCPHCQKETNHVEIRPTGKTSKYTYEDFRQEYEAGRFVNGDRIPIEDLLICSKQDCQYNFNGRCWNANYSFDCPHRPRKDKGKD